MATEAKHIVLQPNEGMRLACLHCGGSYKPALPIEPWALEALGEAFQRRHAGCELREEGEACLYCLRFDHKTEACPNLDCKSYQDWWAGPDTGMSSKCIYVTLLGGHIGGMWGDFHLPLDPDDFGRCHRFLKRFPELRARLPEVAERYQKWGPLVREWDAMTKLYEEEEPSGRAPKLYRLMQTLLDEGRRL